MKEKPPSTRRLRTQLTAHESLATMTQEAVVESETEEATADVGAGAPLTRRAGMQPTAHGPPVQIAVALHEWDGDGNSGEAGEYLPLHAGARVEITPGTELEPGGWWHGTLEDRIGWFPSSFTTLEETRAFVCGGAARGAAGESAASLSDSTSPRSLPKSLSMQALDLGLRAFGAQEDSSHVASDVVRV